MVAWWSKDISVCKILYRLNSRYCGDLKPKLIVLQNCVAFNNKHPVYSINTLFYGTYHMCYTRNYVSDAGTVLV